MRRSNWLLLAGLLAALPATVCVELSAFSCDTDNVTAFPNFYPATKIGAQTGGACPDLGHDADPLGPCFLSPAAAKAALDRVPAGKRALSLEGRSLYWVVNASGATLFQDPLPDGTLSPWVDQWASTVQRRFEAS